MDRSSHEGEGIETLMADLCRDLVAELGGVGCIVSRVIGDVLVHLVDHAPDGRNLQLGRGFLVSEFPETQTVLETGTPSAISMLDQAPDPGEAGVLDELGVTSVLMLALRPRGVPWALVEVYATGRAFDDADAARAQALVERAATRLAALLDG